MKPISKKSTPTQRKQEINPKVPQKPEPKRNQEVIEGNNKNKNTKIIADQIDSRETSPCPFRNILEYKHQSQSKVQIKTLGPKKS